MGRKADVEDVKIAQEGQRIAIQAEEIDQFEQQNEIAQQRLELQEKQLQWRMSQKPSGQ